MCKRRHRNHTDSPCVPPPRERGRFRVAAVLLRHARRPGLTLVELMVSMAVTALVMSMLAGLAMAVRQGWEHADGHRMAMQHARVALERISRSVATATATEEIPGFAIVRNATSPRLPCVLVVWNPDGLPANPEGPALVSECVIYCPDPEAPNRLLEVTAPDDDRPIPLDNLDNGTGRAMVSGIVQAETSRRVVLTDLLRVTSTAITPSASDLRGSVWFFARVRPSQQEWTQYVDGDLEWNELSWPQGEDNPGPQSLYGTRTAMRQAWVRIELQMLPGPEAVEANAQHLAVPFFGSATLNYQMGMEP